MVTQQYVASIAFRGDMVAQPASEQGRQAINGAHIAGVYREIASARLIGQTTRFSSNKSAKKNSPTKVLGCQTSGLHQA
jgi:hypothetical protein